MLVFPPSTNPSQPPTGGKHVCCAHPQKLWINVLNSITSVTHEEGRRKTIFPLRLSTDDDIFQELEKADGKAPVPRSLLLPPQSESFVHCCAVEEICGDGILATSSFLPAVRNSFPPGSGNISRAGNEWGKARPPVWDVTGVKWAFSTRGKIDAPI